MLISRRKLKLLNFWKSNKVSDNFANILDVFSYFVWIVLWKVSRVFVLHLSRHHISQTLRKYNIPKGKSLKIELFCLTPCKLFSNWFTLVDCYEPISMSTESVNEKTTLSDNPEEVSASSPPNKEAEPTSILSKYAYPKSKNDNLHTKFVFLQNFAVFVIFKNFKIIQTVKFLLFPLHLCFTYWIYLYFNFYLNRALHLSLFCSVFFSLGMNEHNTVSIHWFLSSSWTLCIFFRVRGLGISQFLWSWQLFIIERFCHQQQLHFFPHSHWVSLCQLLVVLLIIQIDSKVSDLSYFTILSFKFSWTIVCSCENRNDSSEWNNLHKLFVFDFPQSLHCNRYSNWCFWDSFNFMCRFEWEVKMSILDECLLFVLTSLWLICRECLLIKRSDFGFFSWHWFFLWLFSLLFLILFM